MDFPLCLVPSVFVVPVDFPPDWEVLPVALDAEPFCLGESMRVTLTPIRIAMTQTAAATAMTLFVWRRDAVDEALLLPVFPLAGADLLGADWEAGCGAG